MDILQVQNPSDYDFDAVRRDILDIFYNMVRENFGCYSLVVHRVLRWYRDKEINEGDYSFTADENKWFDYFYRMIFLTRDYRGVNGKGEYSMAFFLINAWNYYFPEYARNALRNFVKDKSYGCWKDIKQFCNYYKEVNGMYSFKYGKNWEFIKTEELPELVSYALDIMNSAICDDYTKYNSFDGGRHYTRITKALGGIK